MRWSLWILLLCFVLIISLNDSEAKRRRKPKKHAPKCKYTRGTYSACTDGIKTKTETLMDTKCAATKTTTETCVAGSLRCKYRRRRWSKCSNGKQKIVRPLNSRSSHRNCPKTQTVTRTC